jgi:uncharacterized protein YggU (UPF0235/DUF167 family)
MPSALDSARLTILVKTRSTQTRMLREADGTLIMQVTSSPEKNKANKELVKWIARKLHKSTSEVRLVSGLHSTSKVVELIGVKEFDLPAVLNRLVSA